jgi:hypothetical protein
MHLHVPLASVLLVTMFSFAISPPVHAASSSLELSELLVDPAAPQTDASDEFIELHNFGSSEIELSDYKLKVGSSSTQHSLPAKAIPPNGYMVVTSATSAWALTNTGGTIALLAPNGSIVDTATWPKAVAGASWMKAPGGAWSWSSSPTPGAPNVLIDITAPAGASGAAAYPALELSELLPDPAAPLTDASDEFIELFNPNSESVNVSGYIIKTGPSLSAKHTLRDTVVPAGSYLAFQSADTKIALSNAGSSVALFDPSGAPLGPVITYGKAIAGASWARFAGSWGWTSQATPGEANVLAIAAPATSVSKGPKSSSGSTSAGSKASSKTTATKAKAKATPAATLAASAPSGSWLLFVLAGLTLAYVTYEFRHDILNFYLRLRRHPGRGPKALEAPERG